MTKRNKLGLAVAAALSIGVAAQSAQAANIAHGGVGELAYVPYYSTTNGKQTYVRLTNNSFDTIAVKLIVREGTNSVDVRDFFIFLSPRDVWTGKVYSPDGGATVRIATNDTSCTVPSKDRGWLRGQFSNDAFLARLDDNNTAIPNDGWSVPLSQNSQEGYLDIRVIGTSSGNRAIETLGEYSPIEFVQHDNRFLRNEAGVPVSVPNDCHAVSAAFDLIQQGDSLELRDINLFNFLKSQYTEPTNALSAVAAIIDPNGGKLTDMPVTTLANVFNPLGADGLSGYADLVADQNDLITPVGARGDAVATATTPREAVIFDDFAGQSNRYTAINGSDTVSAALMSSSISGYVDSTGSNSWVVNFPTKRLYQDGGVCGQPFPNSCNVSISNVVHSVTNSGIVTAITNEEESRFATQRDNQICFSGTDFDANCATTVEGNNVILANEVNVVTLSPSGGANPLTSGLNVGIDSTPLNADNLIGWMQMKFTNAPGMDVANALTNDSVHLNGLPVIGFSYKEYGPASVMTQKYTYTSPLLR